MGSKTISIVAGDTLKAEGVGETVWTFQFKPDEDVSCIDFDEAGCRIFGIAPPSPVDQPNHSQSGIHPQDRPKLDRIKQQLSSAGRASVQVRWKRPNGGYTRLRASLQTVRDDRGALQEVVGQVTAVHPKAARRGPASDLALPPCPPTPQPAASQPASPATALHSTPLLRMLVEQSPIPMALLGLDGSVEYLNSTFLTFFGYPPRAAATLDDWQRLLRPTSATGLSAGGLWRVTMVRNALAGQPIPPSLWTLHTAGGERRTVQIRANAVEDSLLVVFEDVTALQRAEARLERLAQHASCLLIEVSPRGEILFANHTKEDGVVKVVVGQTIEQLGWHPELQCGFSQVTSLLQPVVVEHDRLNPGHGPNHYLAVFQPVLEEDRLQCVVLTLTDVTERKAVDQKLAMRTAALEATTDGVAIVEAQPGRCPVVYVDQAFQRLTGWQESAMLGRTCEEVLCAEVTAPETCEAITAAMRDCLPFDGEALLRRHDGSTFWSRLRVLPVTGQRQVVTHHVWLLLDITSEKKLQQEMAAQQRELARLERLAVMGEVGAAYAHELAQPLSALVGNATAALGNVRTCASGQCGNQEVLHDILESVQRLRQVFDRLRNLTRPNRCVKQLLDLNEVVRETIQLLSKDTATGGVRVQLRLHDPLPQIWLDRVQLQEVLINLLNNALDAVTGVPPTRRHIEVSTAPAPPGGVRLTVTDHGCGIPTDLLPKLFNRSFTTKPHGTGIGLRLCHRMVEAHGGRLEARNNARHGATFQVHLPVGTGNGI